jgi:hypothetical protein
MRVFRSFLLILFIIPAITNAQFAKGDKMVGASIASVVFNSGTADITVTGIGSNVSRITSYNVNIIPNIGWFLSDNMAAGIALNINPTGNKTTYEENGTTFQKDKQNGYNFGLGGFARSYFGHSKSLLPFGQLSVNAGASNLKTEGFFYGGTGGTAYKITYDGNSTGGFFFNTTLIAGFTKMIANNTGLDFYIGYTYSSNKNTFRKTTLRDNGIDGTIDETLKNETTTKFTNNGFLLGVGFQIFLLRHK